MIVIDVKRLDSRHEEHLSDVGRTSAVIGYVCVDARGLADLGTYLGS